MHCVTGNWGETLSHWDQQPGLKSILPFQKGPLATKLWLRPLYSVPNFVLHLMLPLGH